MTKATDSDISAGRDRPGKRDVFFETLARLDDEARRLRFDSEDDAFDHFEKIAEDFYSRLRAEKPDIAKSYADERVYLHLHFRSGLKPHIGKFSAVVVPLRSGRNRGVGDDSIPEGNAAATRGNGLQNAMNFLVTQLVKLPDGFFPSLVRLKAEEEGADRLWNLTPLVSIQVAGGVGRGSSKRKLGPARFGIASDSARTIVDGVVKRGSETVDDIESDNGQFDAKIIGDFDLASYFSRIRIDIGKEAVWLFGENAALDMLELIEVFPCSGHKEFAAPEGFQHA